MPPPAEATPEKPKPSPLDGGDKEVGYVVSTQDYIVIIEGLPSARLYNIVVTRNGGRAMISALEKDRVEALMLDSERPKPGDYFELSDFGLRLPLNIDLFGRMINPLGMALDGKAGLPPGGEALDLDIVAPGIDARAAVTEQFYTGITVVDTLLPIGKASANSLCANPEAEKNSFFWMLFFRKKPRIVSVSMQP